MFLKSSTDLFYSASNNDELKFSNSKRHEEHEMYSKQNINSIELPFVYVLVVPLMNLSV